MMHETDDLSLAVRSWLHEEAAARAPRELLDRVDARTAPLRPRPACLATLRGDGKAARGLSAGVPGGAVMVAVGILVLLLLAATLAVGGALNILTTPVPGPATDLTGTIIEVPPGVTPTITVAEARRAILDSVTADSVGLPPGAVTIRRLAYLLPNSTYSYGSPDADGTLPGSMSTGTAVWVAEVDGTSSICSSFCDASDRLIVTVQRVTDVPDSLDVIIGYRDDSRIYPVPPSSFRASLAEHGLVYERAEPAATGFLGSQAIGARFEQMFAGPGGQRPVFGEIAISDPARAAGRPSDLVPTSGRTRPIWFVQQMASPWAWAVFDATDGRTLATGHSIE